MPWQERIVADSRVLTGKPVVRGSRISVELVVDLLAAGWEPRADPGELPAHHRRRYPGLSQLRLIKLVGE
jgi:hypothetical protein